MTGAEETMQAIAAAQLDAWHIGPAERAQIDEFVAVFACPPDPTTAQPATIGPAVRIGDRVQRLRGSRAIGTVLSLHQPSSYHRARRAKVRWSHRSHSGSYTTTSTIAVSVLMVVPS